MTDTIKIPWEYWDVEVRDDGWVFFGEWRVPQNFQARKKILAEFKEFEKKLVRMGFEGWIGGAYLDDYKMMRLIRGVGGKPYHSDGESIAYYKKLKKENGNEVERNNANA